VRRAAGGTCDRPRRGLVLVLLRGDRDRQVAVYEGRVVGVAAGVPVRLDDPRDRARDRDLDLDRMAVHARRVRRRPAADRGDDLVAPAVRFTAPRAWGTRAR